MAEEQKVRPGYKSTEFLLTLAGNVAAILATIGGVLEPHYSAIIMAVSNGLYALSRGFAKKQ